MRTAGVANQHLVQDSERRRRYQPVVLGARMRHRHRPTEGGVIAINRCAALHAPHIIVVAKGSERPPPV